MFRNVFQPRCRAFQGMGSMRFSNRAVLTQRMGWLWRQDIAISRVLDGAVQPFTQRHAGTTRCLFGSFPRVWLNALDAPWYAWLHSPNLLKPHKRLPKNTAGKSPAGCLSQTRKVNFLGKYSVKHLIFLSIHFQIVKSSPQDHSQETFQWATPNRILHFLIRL